MLIVDKEIRDTELISYARYKYLVGQIGGSLDAIISGGTVTTQVERGRNGLCRSLVFCCLLEYSPRPRHHPMCK
jgi:hypothetical protein